MEDIEQKLIKLEEQVIGILFQDTENTLWQYLDGYIMYSEKHQKIVKKLWDNTNFRFIKTLEFAYPNTSISKEEYEFLLKCVQTINYIPGINYEPFFEELKQARIDLEIRKIGWRIVHYGYDESIEQALISIQLLKAKEKKIVTKSLEETLASLVEKLNQGYKDIKIQNFHLKDLNDILVTPEGTTIIVGARTSVGKTSFLLNLMLDYGRHFRCLYITTEMAPEQLLMRLVCIGCHRESYRIFSHQVDNKYWNESLQKFVELGLHKLKITFCYAPASSPLFIESLIKQYRPDIVFIDFIQQLVLPLNHRYYMRYQELGMIMNELKNIAGQNKVVMYIASQLSRSVELPTVEEPLLSHLKESGNLEEFADIVILLFDKKDKKGKKIKTEKGKVVVVDVAKNRNGKTGRIDLLFVYDYLTFEKVTKTEISSS